MIPFSLQRPVHDAPRRQGSELLAWHLNQALIITAFFRVGGVEDIVNGLVSLCLFLSLSVCLLALSHRKTVAPSTASRHWLAVVLASGHREMTVRNDLSKLRMSA